MLFAMLMISSVVLFVIAPIMALGKYYSPSSFSLKKNILWIMVALFTWPLVPFTLALRRKDILIVSIFALSFGIWLMAMMFLFTLIMSIAGYDLGMK